jgi:hypothetical protein
MICTVCKREGIKSKVYPGAAMKQLAAYFPYYDEEGQQHAHDGNNTRTEYVCSTGHKFMTVTYPKCQCGWQAQRDRVVEYSDDDLPKPLNEGENKGGQNLTFRITERPVPPPPMKPKNSSAL